MKALGEVCTQLSFLLLFKICQVCVSLCGLKGLSLAET